MDQICTNIESPDKNNTENIEKKEPLKKPKVLKNMVLSGGSIKGIAHIGSFFGLKELNLLDGIDTFVGTSVGSLIMSLFVVGYNPAELYDFIKLFDFAKLKNVSITNISQFGLDTGSHVEYVLQKLIEAKGLNPKITLGELYQKKKKKLIFTTVCINIMEVCYLSYETDPDLCLYLAVRMSTSIPFMYTPVKYKDCLYIDGACIDNFPMHLFKDCMDETIGILLGDSKNKIDEIIDLETYILRVLMCIMDGISYSSIKGYENNTVEINMESINIVNYEIDNNKKDELFLKGYAAVYQNIDKLKMFI